MKRSYNQLIAVNLKQKLKEFELNPPPISGFSVSRMEYLISLILTHKQKKYSGSWSVLKMQYMTNIIPHANQYLNFLEREGIVEIKEYSAGRNSRLYRLRSEDKTEYQPITDQKIIFRIEHSKKNILQTNSKKYPELNKYVREVEIDKDRALFTIQIQYLKGIRNGEKDAEIRRTYSLAAIARIESRDIYYKVNSTNGRLDTNVTNLPKELVKHLRINGNPLVEIDIINSQPFFAACLMDPTPEVEMLMVRFLGKSLTMSAKSMNLYQYEDVRLYMKLTTHGKFYEFMMEKFKENEIPFTDRQNFKEQIFVIFFGKSNADKYSPSARLFKKLFPHVQKLFDLIKKEEYNKLAIFLQRLESYIILEEVAKNIVAELSELPILTKHDSLLPVLVRNNVLLVQQDDILFVRCILLDTIERMTNLLPQTKVK